MGIWWLEARDTAKHPVMLMIFLTTKNYPAPALSTAEVEKYGTVR